VGHSTLNWALRYLSATFVATITLAEPVGSSILAYIILHERVAALTLGGGVLILAGLYIASRAEQAARGRQPGDSPQMDSLHQPGGPAPAEPDV